MVFDPGQPWVIDAATLRSQGKNSPFIGYEMQGRVQATLVGGHIVHEIPRQG